MINMLSNIDLQLADTAQYGVSKKLKQFLETTNQLKMLPLSLTELLLNKAVAAGKIKNVKLLLDYIKNNYSVQDVDQDDILHVAVLHGYPKILKLLLDFGYYVDKRYHYKSYLNATPLLIAVEHERVNCVKILLKYGAITAIKYYSNLNEFTIFETNLTIKNQKKHSRIKELLLNAKKNN